MVFFNCSNCGDALKKNAVEKHCNTKCRSAGFVSCVDCGVDFWGNDYVAHTKCISEEQKYNGKDFVSKRNLNKADMKADIFKQQISRALEKCNVEYQKSFMLQLMDSDNVPNKKKKFENYAKNCFRTLGANTISEVWNLIDGERAPLPVKIQEPVKKEEEEESSTSRSPSPEPKSEKVKKLNKRERKEARRAAKSGKPSKGKKNKDKETTDSKDEGATKKSRKRKQDSTEDEDEDEDEDDEEDEAINKFKKMKVNTELTTVSASHKFNWDNVIVAILKRCDDHEIKLKKLQRKVLAEYAGNETNKIAKSEEELLAKFSHKVSHSKRFKCSKNIVKLIK